LRIICPKCGTEYFLEGDQLERDGTPVQCSACEHTFTVFAPVSESPRTPRSNPTASHPGARAPVEQVPRAPTPLPRTPVLPPPPPVRAGSGTLFLAQGDRVYKVKDIATLQRWVVEKRVLPGDRVSNDGKTWEMVSDRAELRAFFAIIDQLKAAKKALKQQTREMTAITHEAEVARHSAIEAAAQIPGPAHDESTVRPSVDVRASGDMPDVAGLSADHAAEPDPELRAASQSHSMPIAAPESVPHLPAVPEEAAESRIEDKFFSASTGSLPAAGPPSEASVSFFDVRSTPIPVDEAAASGAVQDLQAPSAGRSSALDVETTPGAGDPGSPVVASGEHPAATRQVPVQAPSSMGRASGQVAPPSPADEADDFDPNQTFDDIEPFDERRGGAGFYVVLLLLVAAGVGAMWYFLMGPGASEVFDTGIEPVGDGAVLVDDPEPATPEEPASPEATSDATAEPTPEAETPKPTPAPSAEPTTPKPRSEPATPRAEARTPKPKPKGDPMAEANKARDRGDFKSAAAAYTRALEADPRNFGAALQAGWMNVELGKNSSAVSAFKKALAIKGSSAEARYGLGLAYQASGRKAAAISEYERALALEPDGRDAREIRAILSQLQ